MRGWLVALLLVSLAAASGACSSSGGVDVRDAEIASVPDAADIAFGEPAGLDAVLPDAPPAELVETVADTSPDHPAPLQGLLQWHVQHNLQAPDCLPSSCSLTAEDKATMPDWLARARGYSNLAVLHWDDPIPYLAFAEPPPAGADRVAFYDARLDPALLAWLDAFEAHFAQMDKRYLAVSLLGGARDRYQPLRLDDHANVPLSDACPAFDPGTTVTVTVPSGALAGSHAFDPGAAYQRFVLYLRAKLQPDWMALLVEVNMLRTSCPDRWPGVVALYRQLYDAVRAEAGPDLPLFATLHYTSLLAWNEKGCFDLAWSTCQDAATSAYPAPVAASCYPLDASPIADLDAGGRLDVLALSFYPDSLMMAPPELTPPILELNQADWDGQAACWMHAPYGPFVDPIEQLDRLGWTKPVAVAEWSARSCRTLVRVDAQDQSYWAAPDANPETEAFWMTLVLDAARARHFPFVVWSFLEDYDVVPKWTVDQNVLDPWFHGVINGWTCSGLLTRDDQPKPGITEVWRSGME